MTWARISDDWTDRPSLDGLSESALLLYVEGIVYCNRHLTDGLIASPLVLRRLSRTQDPEAAAAELVAVGEWEVSPEGWSLRCFTDAEHPDKQLSADAVRAERRAGAQRQEAYRERGRRHAAGDHSMCTASCPHKGRNGVTGTVTDGVSNGLPSPVQSSPTIREDETETETPGRSASPASAGASAGPATAPASVDQGQARAALEQELDDLRNSRHTRVVVVGLDHDDLDVEHGAA